MFNLMLITIAITFLFVIDCIAVIAISTIIGSIIQLIWRKMCKYKKK